MNVAATLNPFYTMPLTPNPKPLNPKQISVFGFMVQGMRESTIASRLLLAGADCCVPGDQILGARMGIGFRD